jgi:DNA-binding transcriptional LysR family regulator
VPALPRFFAAYPDLELFMGDGDRFVDLVREGIDCVLRAGEPKESDLIARRIAILPEATVASAEYVDRFGMPRRWDALDGHRMIGFRSSATGGVLPLEFMANGVRRTVALPSALSVNGADTYKAAALQGLGLIQVPRYSVEQELADGTLVECLPDTPPSPTSPDTPPSPTSVYVLYPRSRQLSLRVRVFVDWVAKEYASHIGPVATADIARSSH